MRTLFIILLILSVNVFAEEDYNYQDYYIHTKAAISGQINLLNFEHVKQTFPLPAEDYDRAKHFGTWINPKEDTSCLNTRGLVLERDADGPIVKTTTCKVQTGLWHDPYSGNDVTSATLVQIDHLVPLKHAYMTGAYQWDANKRCLYANYLGDRFHLLAVSAHENLSKGDRSPLDYMPANKKFHCSYLKIWLETKLIWDLKLTPKEIQAITQLVRTDNCDTKIFKISQNEYHEQLTYMNDHQDLCHK